MKTWITYKDLIKQLPKSFKDKNRYYELQINYDSGMGCWRVCYEYVNNCDNRKYEHFNEDLCEALKSTLLDYEDENNTTD